MKLDSSRVECLPDIYEMLFSEKSDAGQTSVSISMDGVQLGERLTDNSYKEDFFRFHDIFHLVNAVVLGWSPFFRKILGRKRRSAPVLDEVEDGGRALLAEEAICLVIHQVAMDRLDVESAVAMISVLSSGLEVSAHPLWRQAILTGVEAFKQLVDIRTGIVIGDATSKSVIVRRS